MRRVSSWKGGSATESFTKLNRLSQPRDKDYSTYRNLLDRKLEGEEWDNLSVNEKSKCLQSMIVKASEEAYGRQANVKKDKKAGRTSTRIKR